MKTTHSPRFDLPEAKIKKLPRFSWVWLVPILAAIVAGVLVFQNVRKIGPTISIQFEDGDGLQANQTILRYRGVRVGSVKSVQLTPDSHHVKVEARLDRSAAALARAGTIFWVVRPQVGGAGLHGLETIVSGVYIQAQPGNETGGKQKKFIGAEEAPVLQPVTGGVPFLLHIPAIASLSEGSPVFYRGMEVGSVHYLELAPDATDVEIHVLVKTNFAPLVRTNSVWWNAGGISVSLHFLGISIGAENVKSLVVGGIAFATPPEPGPVAAPGTVFRLYEKAEDKWLKWTSDISITNATSTAPSGGVPSVNLNSANQPQK